MSNNTFVLQLGTSRSINHRSIERYYCNHVIHAYRYYINNLHNYCLTQLHTDVKQNKYDLQEMINSGQLDPYGCLIPSAMKKVRESVKDLEEHPKQYRWMGKTGEQVCVVCKNTKSISNFYSYAKDVLCKRCCDCLGKPFVEFKRSCSKCI